ncbi:unnamed protein product [Lasius platythorax]|uniref:Uncharacterized protein n=1 Tax=Lasius platythorax TaxID=488582 RepID=A0AAV2MXI0_9HYME
MADNRKRSISDYFSGNAVAVPKRTKTSESHSLVDDKHFECTSPEHKQETYAANIPSTSNSNDVGEIITEPSCSAYDVLDDKCRETPLDIAKSITDGPQQPNLKMFPFRKFGVRNRNFQSSWYESYPWLEIAQKQIQHFVSRAECSHPLI